MRFGQLPSVREMTPDITPLLQARQMKDQAFQGIIGFVNKAAEDKVQKEKDAASLKRATALIKQVQSAYPTNAAIQNLDPNIVGKELGKEGIGLINMLAQAELTQSNTLAKIAAEKQSQRESLADIALADLKQKQLIAAEVQGRREKRTKEDTEDVSSKALSIFTSQKQKEEKGTGNRLLDMESIVGKIYDDLPADEKAFVDKEKAVIAAVDRSTELEGEEIDLGSKQLDKKQKEQLIKITGFEIEAAQKEALNYANESEANFRQVARSTNNLIAKQESILETAKTLKNEIDAFRAKLAEEGKNELEIRDNIIAALQSTTPGAPARKIRAAATELASKIGTTTLLEMRSVSKDGSSGFGQLTGIELQTLQSMYGILGTIKDNTFVTVDLGILENSIKSINKSFTEKIANTRYDFQQNFPNRYSEEFLPKQFFRSLMDQEGEIPE